MSLPVQLQKHYFGHTIPTYLQDYDINGNLIYEGYSMPGCNQATAGFVIIKHTYVQNAQGIWEDTDQGALVGKSWSLRTVYTYP